MPRGPNYRKAIAHLVDVDPVLAEIIERVGPCRLVPRAEGSHFEALLRSIMYQQLSGKAAGTIHARLRERYGGRDPLPDELLATADEDLRAAGVSRQKIGYLRDLAHRVHTGELPLDHVHELADHEVIAHLTSVKGVGKWTAQMFLMFRLGRPDVLPDLDLGIQNAIRKAYRKRKQPTPKDVLKIGKKWSPYASVASWYLWRSLENGDGQLGD